MVYLIGNQMNLKMIIFFILIFFPLQSFAGKTIEWKSLAELDKSELETLAKMDTKLSDLVSDGKYIFISNYDYTKDTINDTILFFSNPDDCGTDGCLYVLINGKTNRIDAFTAYQILPSEQGIIVDGRNLVFKND